MSLNSMLCTFLDINNLNNKYKKHAIYYIEVYITNKVDIINKKWVNNAPPTKIFDRKKAQ